MFRDRSPGGRTVSIGVLLGGCGYYDGTDVHEAGFTLFAIEAAGERAILVAPDIAQERTVDHLSGDEVPDARNVLRESARLARRPIRALQEVRHDELEALFIPGGYGPAVNFSTAFARPGEPPAVRQEAAVILRHLVEAGTPLGSVSLGQIPPQTVLGDTIQEPAA